MFAFKRLLVGLDLTEMDENLVHYTRFFAQMMGTEKIYFIHIAKSLILPEELSEKYPDLLAPIDEMIEKQVEFLVKKHFVENSPIEIEIEVKEGTPASKILKWAKIKEVDLLVMGRKSTLKGSGIIPSKVSRASHCSVLYVPEMANQDIKEIVVPIDFSKHSKIALEKAIEIALKVDAKIITQNIYEVPSGYHTTGKDYDEFAETMKGHAQKDFEKFMKKIDTKGRNIECQFKLDESEDTGEMVYELACKEHADLIIIGSKGRTALASMLLGSVAEKLVAYTKDIPLLIMKNKNENLSFLEAILKL